MPFGGTFADQSSQQQVMSANAGTATAGHTSFLIWLVVLGVIVPVAIIGGLQLGGFSFVFRHR
jgi:hypothetical protein